MIHNYSSSIHIRAANADDIPAILDIYSHHVLNGTATFEEVVPTVEDMHKRWFGITQKGFPYLVAVQEDKICGYAYLNTYRPRNAYRFTVENSIYLHKDCIRKGMGSLLLQALIREAEQGPWHQMIAVIGDSQNHASIHLHQKAGFTLVGIEPETGFKFGRWIDTVIMYKKIKTSSTL